MKRGFDLLFSVQLISLCKLWLKGVGGFKNWLNMKQKQRDDYYGKQSFDWAFMTSVIKTWGSSLTCLTEALCLPLVDAAFQYPYTYTLPSHLLLSSKSSVHSLSWSWRFFELFEVYSFLNLLLYHVIDSALQMKLMVLHPSDYLCLPKNVIKNDIISCCVTSWWYCNSVNLCLTCLFSRRSSLCSNSLAELLKPSMFPRGSPFSPSPCWVIRPGTPSVMASQTKDQTENNKSRRHP